VTKTGDKKKGATTDYVARQYIENPDKIENGIVSVNAYGVLREITVPLVFEVFKPQKRLKSEDQYKTKPHIRAQISVRRGVA
jgi:SRSO17 transposase